MPWGCGPRYLLSFRSRDLSALNPAVLTAPFACLKASHTQYVQNWAPEPGLPQVSPTAMNDATIHTIILDITSNLNPMVNPSVRLLNFFFFFLFFFLATPRHVVCPGQGSDLSRSYYPRCSCGSAVSLNPLVPGWGSNPHHDSAEMLLILFRHSGNSFS